jgi:hypothetical protein
VASITLSMVPLVGEARPCRRCQNARAFSSGTVSAGGGAAFLTAADRERGEILGMGELYDGWMSRDFRVRVVRYRTEFDAF